MATAGALIGLRTPGVLVENIETTAKTMPDFAQMWISMVESPSPALLPVGLANE
jgi:3-phosphoshikimate 1-carboxyvinyltransferase